MSRNAAGTELPTRDTAVSRFIRAPKSLLAKRRSRIQRRMRTRRPAGGGAGIRPQAAIAAATAPPSNPPHAPAAAGRAAGSAYRANVPPVRAAACCRTGADLLQAGLAARPGLVLVGASANPAKTRLRGYVWFNRRGAPHPPARYSAQPAARPRGSLGGPPRKARLLKRPAGRGIPPVPLQSGPAP